MKIKRTVLRSIIEAVIREQPEGWVANPDDDDLAQAYEAIAEATMSVEWGREISFLVVKAVSALFSRFANSGEISFTELIESVNKILSNPRFLGVADQISAKALKASDAYASCSPTAKKIAYDALQRVVRAAFESLVGSEIAYVILYNLSEVSTEFSAMKQDVDTNEQSDPRFFQPGDAPLPKIPVNDIEGVQAAISSLDTLRVAQTTWEIIMKFVGATHRHENSHFSEVADLSLFGLEDDGWGLDIFSFGSDIPVPF